jgi:hypothetical protein
MNVKNYTFSSGRQRYDDLSFLQSFYPYFIHRCRTSKTWERNQDWAKSFTCRYPWKPALGKGFRLQTETKTESGY